MRQKLEHLYDQYNRRIYVHPDPLEFLYHYEDIKNREIVGLIASSLAYGKVAQILKSISRVQEIMGDSPFEYLTLTPESEIFVHYQSFVHRFAKGIHLSALLIGIKNIIAGYGSIYNCFIDGFSSSDETVLPALSDFSKKINGASDDCSLDCHPGHLMPCPDKGSACKRLNLFLRWMVRCDDVDPGGWHEICSSKLIVPLDVHMFRISCNLGLTTRSQASLKTAIEITEGFRKWSPADPVRYDFALTRFGIRNDLAGNNALLMKLGI